MVRKSRSPQKGPFSGNDWSEETRQVTATYGAIGGIIVTMLWFYVSSVAILIGAELNGVMEKSLATEKTAANNDVL